MPVLRRSRECCRASWVAVQLARRDSRGWVDCSCCGASGEVVVVEVREERRVSCRPGAEGAPRSRVEGFLVLVLVVEVGWEG